MADKNPLDMSDDDIANMSAPPSAPAKEETEEEKAARLEAEAQAVADADKADDDAQKAAVDGEDDDPEKKDGDNDPDPDKKDDDEPELDADGKPVVKTPEEKPAEKAVDSVGSKTKADDQPKDDNKPKAIVAPNVEAAQDLYSKIMTPFKANGKLIELKTPEEAIQLMQMGANYTRKLQDIQPHRKMILMLQNNGLLDEGKLSYLIDLDKKDPEAIKKLIKESGIDPLEIDTTTDTNYRPGNHSVTDEEANFRTTMGELVSSGPKGKETVAEVYDNWDDTSKEVLWKEPKLLSIIHEQRENGVYDLIKSEVDRRITLGTIPANTPFFEAYKAVGDDMVAQAGVKTDSVGTTQTDVKRDVLTTRAAAPKSKVANGEKADAASPTKAGSKAAKVLVNPLAISDEEFLKQMDGRL